MKTYLLTFVFIFSLVYCSFGQPIIQCPADVTVDLFDHDPEYMSYGQPIVTSSENYQVTSSFTTVNNTCIDIHTRIKYDVVDDSGNTAFCNQLITLILPELTDVIWPDSLIDLSQGGPEDTHPDNTGYPEPKQFLEGESNIITTYDDQVIDSGPGAPYKVLRNWTALDWCSGDIATFRQIIKINEFDPGTVGVLNVPTCYNGITIKAQQIEVTTDQPNFEIDNSSCILGQDNLLEYVNCIAENNNIDDNSYFEVKLTNNQDPLNGVSTLDLVLTQRYILGIDVLDSSCKVFGADVNNDNRVSAIDLVESRKLILGINPTFSQSDSWRFYNKNLIDGTNPQGGLGPIIDNTDLKFNKSEFPLQTLEVIAVKAGDVNGSAVGN